VANVAPVRDAAAGAHQHAAGGGARPARRVGHSQPAVAKRGAAGDDAGREPELERQRAAGLDGRARALRRADEAEAVVVARGVGGDPGRGRDGAEREPGDDPAAPPPQQRRQRRDAQHERQRLVVRAEQPGKAVLARPRSVVERRDQLVAGTADQQLAGGEAGDRDRQRGGAGAGLPQHPGHAPASERHAGAEHESTGELRHRQQRRPARVRVALERADAERDQQREQQQLHGDGDRERAQQPRTALERRAPQRTVEAQAVARHNGARRQPRCESEQRVLHRFRSARSGSPRRPLPHVSAAGASRGCSRRGGGRCAG